MHTNEIIVAFYCVWSGKARNIICIYTWNVSSVIMRPISHFQNGYFYRLTLFPFHHYHHNHPVPLAVSRVKLKSTRNNGGGKNQPKHDFSISLWPLNIAIFSSVASKFSILFAHKFHLWVQWEETLFLKAFALKITT